jgi:hypothetical protein
VEDLATGAQVVHTAIIEAVQALRKQITARVGASLGDREHETSQ